MLIGWLVGRGLGSKTAKINQNTVNNSKKQSTTNQHLALTQSTFSIDPINIQQETNQQPINIKLQPLGILINVSGAAPDTCKSSCCK
jgi:hypothetical protein